MNILSMQYFQAVVEEGSISAAARKLFISQQTLSEHIRKLENEVGTPLFLRGKHLILTLAGESFLLNSKEILKSYDTLLSDIQDITHERLNRITIAIPTCFTPPYLGSIVSRFIEKYPQCEVRVVKRQHTDIAHNMQGVDLYMSYLPLSDSLNNIPVIEHDPYCVCFHRHLAEKTYGERWPEIEEKLILTQDLCLLKEMPFLLQMDRYTELVKDIDLIFQEYDFKPQISSKSESCAINEIFCLDGIGCLLATESHIRYRFDMKGDARYRELLSYPIKVESFCSSLCLSAPVGNRLHSAEKLFIQEAQAFFQES